MAELLFFLHIESIKDDAKKTQDQALELIDQLRKQLLTYEKE